MNNTTKYYSLIIAVVVLFAMMTVSCEKSPVDKGTDETDRMIDIRTSIEALTKSPALDGNGEGNFSNGDIFTLVVSGSGFPNIDTSYTVGTTDLSWADLNLPEDAGNVYFSGCYPVQGKAVDGILTFVVSTAEKTDLLLAEAVQVGKNSEDAVSLVFKHALHKLVVKYVSDDLTDEQLSEISTSVKALSSCGIDLAKGAIQNGTASGLSEVGTMQGSQVSCFIVPQEKDNVTLEVSLGDMVRTLSVPDNDQDGRPVSMLDGGRCLTVQINVSSDKIELDGVQIEGWGQQGSVDGDIEL